MPGSGINFYIHESPFWAHPECAVTFQGRMCSFPQPSNETHALTWLLSYSHWRFSVVSCLRSLSLNRDGWKLLPSGSLLPAHVLWVSETSLCCCTCCVYLFSRAAYVPVSSDYWPALAKQSSRCRYSVSPNNV